VQTPDRHESGRDTYLDSVAAPASDEAVAVGISRVPGEGGASFLELQSWDGAEWSELDAPDVRVGGEGPSVSSVAAAGPSDAWAVGLVGTQSGGRPLALHWNGRDWSEVAVPAVDEPESHLFAVAATATDDVWAVGGWARPGALRGGGLVAHWDGSSWATEALPTTNRPEDRSGGPYDILTGVAGSSGSDVWAVGQEVNVPQTYARTLIMHWDGQGWERVPSPNVMPSPGGGEVDDNLTAVDAIAPDDAWAVGSYEREGLRMEAPITTAPLALHWNGTAWTVVELPSVAYGELTGVVALAADDVWAVGHSAGGPGPDGSPLVLHWDGAAWRIVDTPVAGPGNLAGVAATPQGELWAVGTAGPGSPGRSLILRCD
jgi:hypothetical protein